MQFCLHRSVCLYIYVSVYERPYNCLVGAVVVVVNYWMALQKGLHVFETNNDPCHEGILIFKFSIRFISIFRIETKYNQIVLYSSKNRNTYHLIKHLNT